MRSRRKRGFTLAELLIVVAIIGVLVAIAIPVFTSQLEKAREATCLSNRTSLQHMLIYTAMIDEDAFADITGGVELEWANVKPKLEATGNSFTDKICPSGGEITIFRSENTFIVSCSKHNGTPSTILLKNFLETIKNDSASWASNDRFRQTLYDQLGGWPKMTFDGTTYQIEPYYNKTTKDSWLFARIPTDGNQNKGWTSANFVYDPASSQWYQSVNQNGKPTSANIMYSQSGLAGLQAEVKDETKWKPVTITYNK